MHRDFGRGTRRILRQLANTAWERELDAELKLLAGSFAEWKAGELGPHELSFAFTRFITARLAVSTDFTPVCTRRNWSPALSGWVSSPRTRFRHICAKPSRTAFSTIVASHKHHSTMTTRTHMIEDGHLLACERTDVAAVETISGCRPLRERLYLMRSQLNFGVSQPLHIGPRCK